MFHVELRQFPNVTRSFNMTRAELDERVLRPWVAGSNVELNDRRWSREKARLTIYDGPEMRSDEMGLGRGWANVTRAGRDVTADILADAETAAITLLDEATAQLKAEVARRAGEGPLAVHEVLLLAHQHYPSWRVSERLALAERSVWEMLHQGQVRMARAGEPVEAADWEQIVLGWETWTGEARPTPVLEA